MFKVIWGTFGAFSIFDNLVLRKLLFILRNGHWASWEVFSGYTIILTFNCLLSFRGHVVNL